MVGRLHGGGGGGAGHDERHVGHVLDLPTHPALHEAAMSAVHFPLLGQNEHHVSKNPPDVWPLHLPQSPCAVHDASDTRT